MISDSTIQQVPVNLMTTNPIYHSGISQKKLKYMVEDWDENFVGLPIISLRDGIYYVVDGKYRKEAAIELSIKNMKCRVYTDLTFEEEVKLFQQINMCEISTFTV